MVASISLCLSIFLSQSPEAQQAQATQLEGQKQYSSAAKVWSDLSAENPTDPRFPLNAANDYYSAKEYLRAIPFFWQADKLGVSYKWDMPYSIACCYALAGQKKEALDTLEKAINLGFRDLALVRTDKDLESLHADPRFIDLAFTADTTKMDRNAGYRYDLRLLNRELHRLHYNLFTRHSPKDFDAYVRRLDSDIPKLSDPQIAIRFKELAAMAGDGHTHLTTAFEVRTAKLGLPVGFSTFAEGTFITRSDAHHKDLLGAQVLKVEGLPVEESLKKLIPICSYENTMWILARAPEFLRYPGLLNGLGMSKSDSKTTLTIRDQAGSERQVVLGGDADGRSDDWISARSLSPNPTPLTFAHRDKNYWFEQMTDSKTVFAQYNAVMEEKDESIAKFADRLFSFIADHDVDRLVLDIRWNGGGNNFLNKPLLDGLIKSKVNARGKLFVIVGRNTFSAAMCFATQIERYTNAIFAGEPTGSSPNFIGESIPFNLPYSKMSGTISDLYWQNSNAMDHRVWIAPEIYLQPKFADYIANRDPILDAIQSFK